MKLRVVKYWENARSSYWFIPSLMALGAMVAALVLVQVDFTLGSGWMEPFPILYENRPEGARQLLATIAGSMITVAGVTFSITIAAVAYAASQFGPRLLTNFMRDRGNQITLGTFIATFLYCILVLRTIRSAGEPVDGGIDPASFVPQFAVLAAIGFALASIGVLIYFIHHIPDSIHAANVIAGIGVDLNRKLQGLFPESIGYGPVSNDQESITPDVPADFYEGAKEVRARSAGYLQYINEERLLRTAVEHDLLIRLLYRPGDFVREGKVLAMAYPQERVDDEANEAIVASFAWGRKRTQVQDPIFLADELVEISMRALSPSLNDPFTAMNCIDWLGSAISNLGGRDVPTPLRYDKQRRLRVIARPVTFEQFADRVFDGLRPYVTADENASLHMLKVMADVVVDLDNEPYRKIIQRHANIYREVCLSRFTHERVRDQIEARSRSIARLVRNPAGGHTLADVAQWPKSGR